ncbi:MAG: AAA family ATPase [Pikeienuella sp.]
MNKHKLNAYAVVNPIKATAQIAPGKAARDDDIAASFFHWADADDAQAAENIRSFVGPRPTFVVLTGTQPCARPHVYWELEEPTQNLDAWRKTQEAIAVTLATDPAVVNPSRIMRIGGTINWPKPKKREKGYVTEVCELHIHDEDERPHVTSERMARAFEGAAPKQSDQGITIATGDVHQTMNRALATANILAGSDWRENLKRLVASYVARGWTDDEILARCAAFTLHGWTAEQTQEDVAAFIHWTREQEARNGGNFAQSPEQTEKSKLEVITDLKIKSSDEFLADLKPLEYLIDGVLPTGVVYSLTGYPGHGKTTLAIQLALSVSLGEEFSERDTESGDVLFLAGENPYNLKWQYAAALAARDITSAPRLHFVEGHFSISAMTETLNAKMAELPNLKLVIIDSLQAFFEGDDDNANIKMVEAARQFREIGNVGSRPAVLVIAHPAGKEPKRENLVPRGGGAFLAEIDGNLTVWGHGEDQQTLHHSPKFRGAGFEPMDFVMATYQFDHLTDTHGTPLRLKVSRQALQIEQSTRADRHNDSLRRVLVELSGYPRMSLRELQSRTGIPKSTVSDLIYEAKDEKLIRRHAKGWKITEGGEEYLDG